MSSKLSRRKLADHAAARLSKGDSASSVMKELAAYLIDTRRTSELELVVRDIEAALADDGTVLVRTTSARPLSSEAKDAVEAFVGHEYGTSAKVVLQEQIDESVIGGVKLETPDKQLDATIKTKLEKLTA